VRPAGEIGFLVTEILPNDRDWQRHPMAPKGFPIWLGIEVLRSPKGGLRRCG
jgi:hypothetical protein